MWRKALSSRSSDGRACAADELRASSRWNVSAQHLPSDCEVIAAHVAVAVDSELIRPRGELAGFGFYVPAVVELLGAMQPGETFRLRGDCCHGENGAVTFSAISLAMPPKGEQAAAAKNRQEGGTAEGVPPSFMSSKGAWHPTVARMPPPEPQARKYAHQ